MISRLKNKKKGDNMPSSIKVPPTKEDILNTLENYEKEDKEDPGEDNNNINAKLDGSNHENKAHLSTDGKRRLSQGSTTSNDSRRDSVNSGLSEDWEQPDVMSYSVSHSNSYSKEWERLFMRNNYRRVLRDYAISGQLRSSRYRSVCWKVFLDVLPDDVEQWIKKTRAWRKKYDDLKRNLIVNPRGAVDQPSSNLVLNNPLSQADESPWNQFFIDNELRLTIKQDVIRTFPEIEFFQKDDLQEKMIDLLFCLSKTNGELSYKQGMHEVLAPLIFILHCDHQAFIHASEVEFLEEIIKELMDPSYLEHDAYAMMSQIMQTIEPWYISKDIPQTKVKNKHSSAKPFARPQDMNSSNVIVTKLTRIQDYILKKFDPELHGHLERLEIAPQIYGIRWVRLLFGREFPMQDLLALWDAIFADGIGFELVDYIFVSMLLYIRDLLLASDYPQCLNCLMRYPPVADIHYMIDKAHYLREPNHYPRPANYSYHSMTAKNSTSPKTAREHGNKPKSISTSWSEFSKKMRPKTLTMSTGEQGMYKSTSVPMNLQTDISPGIPSFQPKRGSTASLSHVEDSMTRPIPSPASMARLEPSTRSVDSSPAEYRTFQPETANGNIQQFASLPRQSGKGKKYSKQEQDLESLIATLQGQINERDSMSEYCACKLDVHITRLQTELLQQSLQNEDEVLLAIAGIKQVRDVLRGTLKFSQMGEEEISIKDNYFVKETLSSSSPESDQSEVTEKSHDNVTKDNKKKMFYMSSEENSAAGSPTEHFASDKTKLSRKLSKGSLVEASSAVNDFPKDVELVDYAVNKPRSWSDSKWDYGLEKLKVSEKSKSGRSRSHSEQKPTSVQMGLESVEACIRNSKVLEPSPNPLYRRDLQS